MPLPSSTKRSTPAAAIASTPSRQRTVPVILPAGATVAGLLQAQGAAFERVGVLADCFGVERLVQAWRAAG